MKKEWVCPGIEVLDLGFTANDYKPGSGGDGRKWVSNGYGGGYYDLDMQDYYGPATTRPRPVPPSAS